MYRSSPFRSTLNTGYITDLDMCKVCTRNSPLRSTLNHGDVKRKEVKMQVGFQPAGLNIIIAVRCEINLGKLLVRADQQKEM